MTPSPFKVVGSFKLYLTCGGRVCGHPPVHGQTPPPHLAPPPER